MKTIHAIYENGVFRPTEPVELPNGSRVTVQPESPEVTSPTVPDDDGLDPIYEVLSRRHRSGHRDTAERHNEHQP
jgi:predicted DNA-binding antitoxin AbrB/MazE fold protein